MAKVDASKEVELAKEHMIKGFPTLTVFRKGAKIEDYSGERNAVGIIAYMKKMNDPNWKPAPSAVVPLTAENFTKFIKNEKLSLVMWYAPWCKHCKQITPGNHTCTQSMHTFLFYKVVYGSTTIYLSSNSSWFL